MKRQVRHLTLALIALCFFAHGAMAQNVPDGTVIYVKQGASGTGDGSSWTDAYSSLSVALEYANANASEDNLLDIWVAAGTYYPATLKDPAAYSDDPELNDPRFATFYIPHNVTVYGGFPDNNDNATLTDRNIAENTTTLSGDLGNNTNAYHVVFLDGGTLDGCTVTGGKADKESENEWNRNKSGGGVYAAGGTLRNNTIHGNTANGNGAGAYNSGQGRLTMDKNTIYNNHAGVKGGGVCYGIGKVIDNEIYGNTAPQGGGIYVSTGGTASLLNNSIYANTATTGNGGGIYHDGGTVWGVNNTIYGNSAAGHGGGVYSQALGIWINNTITQNRATGDGDGVYVNKDWSVYINNWVNCPSLYNNIIWGNNDENKNLFVADFPNGNPNDPSEILTIKNNLIGGDASQLPTDDRVVNFADNIIGSDVDPLFVDADNYDFSLLANSPAINKGDNVIYEDEGAYNYAPDTDRAGNPRLYGSTIDLGAYEFQSEPETPETPEEPDLSCYTITLTVAPGITSLGYITGEYEVASDDHFHLQFLPTDGALTAADVLLLVDGVETSFRDFGDNHYFSHFLNPVTQDHTVLIALREYTITFPQVEGLTITTAPTTRSDLTGETIKVAYGAPYSFTLSSETLDLSALKVFANGTELTPAADGTYTIDKVEGPITITVEGITTTSNTVLLHGIRVAVESGKLKVESEKAVDVSVYAITGQTVAQIPALRGSQTISLRPGVYVVRAGNTNRKIIINY